MLSIQITRIQTLYEGPILRAEYAFGVDKTAVYGDTPYARVLIQSIRTLSTKEAELYLIALFRVDIRYLKYLFSAIFRVLLHFCL